MKLVLNYDFPKGNPQPFDPTFEGNYFVLAKGYSNLIKDLRDISGAEMEKHIPMGATTLIFCYRLAFVEKGEILKEWPFLERENLGTGVYSGKFLLCSEKPLDTKETEPYAVVCENLEMLRKKC